MAGRPLLPFPVGRISATPWWMKGEGRGKRDASVGCGETSGMLTARERDRAIRRWESSSIGASSSSLGLEDEDEDEGNSTHRAVSIGVAASDGVLAARPRAEPIAELGVDRRLAVARGGLRDSSE